MNYRAVPQNRQRKPALPPCANRRNKHQQQHQHNPDYQQLLLLQPYHHQQQRGAASVPQLAFYRNAKDNIATTTPVVLYNLVHYNNYYNYCQYRTVNNSTFHKLQQNAALATAPFLFIHIPIRPQQPPPSANLQFANNGVTNKMGYRYRYNIRTPFRPH